MVLSGLQETLYPLVGMDEYTRHLVLCCFEPWARILYFQERRRSKFSKRETVKIFENGDGQNFRERRQSTFLKRETVKKKKKRGRRANQLLVSVVSVKFLGIKIYE